MKNFSTFINNIIDESKRKKLHSRKDVGERWNTIGKLEDRLEGASSSSRLQWLVRDEWKRSGRVNDGMVAGWTSIPFYRCGGPPFPFLF